PSWGEQEDQCATILWGMGQHYQLTRDESFLADIWPTVRKGVDHILRKRDHETGLIGPSIDLWEEKTALHTYTNAAGCAAIRESSKMASILGHDALSVSWAEEAKEVQNAVTTLWMALYQCRLRNYDKARVLMDWCAKHVDELQLFAEQVHKDSGEPVSASPLAWSHAMFILSLLDYRSA